MNISRKILALTVVCSLALHSTPQSQNHICVSRTLEPLLKASPTLNNGDVVALDVDHTILRYNGTRPQLLDLELPKILKELSKKGVTILAITASTPTSHHAIKGTMEQERPRELQNLDIPTTKIKLPEGTTLSSYPSPNGIIYSGGKSKGKRLSEFLDSAKLKPQKIVFVDDRGDHIVSVHLAMSKRNINSTCIYYWKCPIGSKFSKYFTAACVLAVLATSCIIYRNILRKKETSN